MTHDAHALTAKGTRSALNQDALLADEHLGLYAVADGVMVGAAGELAAALAVRATHQAYEHWIESLGWVRVASQLAYDGLVYAVQAAASAVYEEGRGGPHHRIATSLTAALVTNGRLLVASVGDTRALLVREGRAQTLTRVDTVAEELVREGVITRTEARTHRFARVLTRALGPEPAVAFDSLAVDLIPGDRIVLVTNGVQDAERVVADAIALRPHLPPEGLARVLVAEAGDDDSTAVVVERARGVARPAPTWRGRAVPRARARVG